MTSSTYSIILVIFIVIFVDIKCMNRWDEAYCIQTFAVIVGQCVQIVYIAWILFVVSFQHQTWQWIHVFDVHFYAFFCALKLWFLPRKVRGNGMCVVVTNTDSLISNSRENKYATKKALRRKFNFQFTSQSITRHFFSLPADWHQITEILTKNTPQINLV